jgi:hypothetical protein
MSDHLHIYVDEAGCPTLFGKKRGSGVIIGHEGCSQYFIMGKLEVNDPRTLSTGLHELHRNILNDPYFSGVESFKPERKKTALGFHANNDLPEVRFQVFNFLKTQEQNIRFHAVVADKRIIAQSEQKRRVTDPKAVTIKTRCMTGLFAPCLANSIPYPNQRNIMYASPNAEKVIVPRHYARLWNMPKMILKPNLDFDAAPGASKYQTRNKPTACKRSITFSGRSNASMNVKRIDS